MKVSEVMTREVEFVPADATVREAATTMAEHDIGAVLVGSAERPEGILTDRDIILRVVVEGCDLTDLRVRDAMSSTLFTCRADDPLEAVAKEMEERQVRRLPVVGDGGAVVGIVVRSDLVRAIADEPKSVPADEPEPASPSPSRR
jgi:CBS domain-containing protein